jgi:flagellar operon protein
MNDIKNQYLIRRQQVVGQTPPAEGVHSQKQSPKSNVSFNDVLKQISEKESVKFSKHAMNRLSERDIHLTADELKKINQAVNQAEGKGIRDALILMDDKIFIANVKSRTIVTAADEKHLKENVFTNIDGAVIV